MTSDPLQHALGLQAAGRIEESAKILRDILSADPGHLGARYSLGIAYLHLGQHEAADAMIASAIELNPQFPNSWHARGIVLSRLGRWQEALANLDQALALKPEDLDTMAARVHPLRQLGRLLEALAAADRVLAFRPDSADAWNARGLVLIELARFDEAIASFDRALAITPVFPETMLNRGTALLEARRPDEALEMFDAILASEPDNVVALNNRGNVHLAKKEFEAAIADYDRALALNPQFELARQNRGHALLGLGRATRCPILFLRRTFDDASGSFEETMTSLSYRTPRDMRDFASRLLPQSAGKLRILDLGCGTGLVGDAFRDLAAEGRLDGLDVSPRMIEQARKRGIYGRFILGDAETVLASVMPQYDLVLAGDTIIYLGDLAPIFAGAAKCLTAGGLFLFSVELKDGEGWEQTPANRFRHSESYLRAQGKSAGLIFAGLKECSPRTEAGAPVPGLLIAFRKPEKA